MASETTTTATSEGETKFCSLCKHHRHHEHFTPDKSRPSGFRSWCNPCRAARERHRRANNPEKVLWSAAKSRARRAGLPFNLEPGDIVIPTNCPVLGIPLERSKNHMADASPSLDRIIPALGYVKGNVDIISMRANRLKNDLSEEELSRILDYIRAHQQHELRH